MLHEERKRKIESYGQAFDSLSRALEGFPKEMWKYKPLPDKWSIHEVIIHLADSEANSYIRCRRFVAEPGLTVMAYDQDLWANRLDYHKQDPELSLELFRLLRLTTYRFIRELPEQVWANVIDHPENGLMTMDDWLNIYEEHVRIHIAQMQRNYDAWRKEHPQESKT